MSIEFPIFKLDCGDEPTFRTINRPVPDLKISEIIAGLNRLSKRFKITIQTVFIDGVVPNFSLESHLRNGLPQSKTSSRRLFKFILPTARLPTVKVKMLSKNQLEEIAQKVSEKTSVLTQAYSI